MLVCPLVFVQATCGATSQSTAKGSCGILILSRRVDTTLVNLVKLPPHISSPIPFVYSIQAVRSCAADNFCETGLPGNARAVYRNGTRLSTCRLLMMSTEDHHTKQVTVVVGMYNN